MIKTLKVSILIKSALIALLFGCLFEVSYSYYSFVRLSAVIGFAMMGYISFYIDKKVNSGICYIGLAALFIPGIYRFDKLTWNIIDLAIAVGLVASIVSAVQPARFYSILERFFSLSYVSAAMKWCNNVGKAILIFLILPLFYALWLGREDEEEAVLVGPIWGLFAWFISLGLLVAHLNYPKDTDYPKDTEDDE